MGAEGAANIIYKKEIAAASDPKAKYKELVDDYREKFSNPYLAADYGFVTDVIMPSETRYKVALSLRSLMSKRVITSPKKHGLSPL
jgi:propionyl-CoA carboxylase beta chain